MYWHTGLVGSAAREWARLFGITAGHDKSYRLLGGTWNVSDEIFIPPIMIGTFCSAGWKKEFLGYRYKKEIMAWVRSQLYRSMGFLGGATGAMLRDVATSILLVRRHPQGAGEGRRVLNHEAVVRTTKEVLAGWTITEYSDYPALPSVLKTCQLFHDAALIMGPHGAGFSNLACARPGAVLVEFQAVDHHDDFEIYAQTLGLGYVGIRTDMKHRENANVSVDKVAEGLTIAKRLIAAVTGRGIVID